MLEFLLLLVALIVGAVWVIFGKRVAIVILQCLAAMFLVGLAALGVWIYTMVARR